jgi:hypothetical protein
MNSFIFIFGLLIGVSLFVYIYSVVTEGPKKIRELISGQEKEVKESVEPENIGFRGIRSLPPGSRICPLCGSTLTKYEGLYATNILENNEKKLLIMGCKYCFKDN